jgi:hypothetical protein
VAGFADDLMLKYGDDAKVSALLVPAGDATHARVRHLLDAVYSFPFLTIRSVEEVKLLGKEFQVPLAAPVELRGTLERPADPAQLMHLVLASRQLGALQWVGMELDVRVTAKVEVTSGAVERILSEDLSDVSTLADFESKFDFIDMPAFMAEAGVGTLAELKARLPQQFRMLYAQPPAFDPNDPRVQRRFRLAVCVLFEPDLDLEAALRTVREARDTAAVARPCVGELEGGEVRGPAAWIVVFPSIALPSPPRSQAQVEALFASADVVAAFETPN